MGNSLIDDLEPLLRDERAAALATLVSATGSTSKKIGAKMVVGASGRLIGAVTIGGCIDAQVIEVADDVVGTGERQLLKISLDDDEAWEIGLTCGGNVEVLVERLDPTNEKEPILAGHRAVRRALERGQSAAIATPVEGGSAALVVDETGARTGTLGDNALDEAAAALATQTIADGQPRVEQIGDTRVFIERHAPPVTVILVGAGQIAVSLTRYARELDMRVVIVDGRERYATKQRFPEADEVLVGMPSEIVAGLGPDKNSAVVLVSHDYKYELPVLRQLLRNPPGYLGMLGSKRRAEAMRSMLMDEGFTAEEVARIRTPIGLAIGGKSSAEVALSIMAEIVAVRAGKA